MKIEIVEKNKNPLLKRDEIELKIEHEGPTPSRTALLTEIAKELKVDQKHIIINKILKQSGLKMVKVKAELYKNVEDIPIKKQRSQIVKEKVEQNGKRES
jgi:ribosomal protein S24E